MPRPGRRFVVALSLLLILVNNANATTGSSVSWLQTLFIIQVAITGSGSCTFLPSISAIS